MKLNTGRYKFLKLFIYIMYFTTVASLSYAQTHNPDLRIDYKDDLLTLSAQNADLKNVLSTLAYKTGISIRFPKSLKKQITTKISGVSLGEALSKILRGMNHAIIYSGSRKNRAVISEVFVYKNSKRSMISKGSILRENKIASQIRSYERRLELLNKKLSQIDNNSTQGKRYSRQVRSYENIIENLKRKIR